MSVLGQHTISEVRHLMNTVEFRLQQNQPVFDGIKGPATVSPEYIDLAKDYDAFKARWARARDEVLNRILVLNMGNPLLPASSIPAENEYKTVRKAINVGGGDTYTKGDLMDILIRTEKLAGRRFDETKAPQPPADFDPDHAGYRAVDSAIKQGEAAAEAAAKKGKELAKSNVGLIVLGAVGVAIAGGVVAKVYL